MKRKVKKVNKVVEKEAKKFSLKLIDFKIEFGKLKDELIIIDALNSDTMRLTLDKKILEPEEILKCLKLKMP